MPDDFLIEAFMDAIREKRDAAEFERLMLGKREKGLGSLDDSLDLIHLIRWYGWEDERSALDELRARLALERLQGRYSDLWERVELTGVLDAS